MRKTILFIIFILMSLILASCSGNTRVKYDVTDETTGVTVEIDGEDLVNKNIKKGREYLEKKKYDKAKKAYEEAKLEKNLDKGLLEEAEQVCRIIDSYNKIKEGIDNKQFDEAKNELDHIDSNYMSYPIKDDIKEFSKTLYANTKGEEMYNNKEFYFGDKKGFQLEEVDKAASQAAYVLKKTNNAGDTWEVVNIDPFKGTIGSVTGIYFMDENIGFIGSRDVAATERKLYRTEDGGRTFNQVNYDEDERYTYAPRIPYEENGELYTKVRRDPSGQGTFDETKTILYKSKDKGVTWEFVKEVEPEKQ